MIVAAVPGIDTGLIKDLWAAVSPGTDSSSTRETAQGVSLRIFLLMWLNVSVVGSCGSRFGRTAHGDFSPQLPNAGLCRALSVP